MIRRGLGAFLRTYAQRTADVRDAVITDYEGNGIYVCEIIDTGGSVRARAAVGMGRLAVGSSAVVAPLAAAGGANGPWQIISADTRATSLSGNDAATEPPPAPTVTRATDYPTILVSGGDPVTVLIDGSGFDDTTTTDYGDPDISDAADRGVTPTRITAHVHASAAAARGTITAVTTSADIVGTGTHFTDFTAGQLFVVGDERRRIDHITDDTHLTIEAAPAADVTDVLYRVGYPLTIGGAASLPDFFEVVSVEAPADSRSLWVYTFNRKIVRVDKSTLDVMTAYPDAVGADSGEIGPAGTHLLAIGGTYNSGTSTEDVAAAVIDMTTGVRGADLTPAWVWSWNHRNGLGANGYLWGLYTDAGAVKLQRLAPDGTVTGFVLDATGGDPSGEQQITADDTYLWATAGDGRLFRFKFSDNSAAQVVCSDPIRSAAAIGDHVYGTVIDGGTGALSVVKFDAAALTEVTRAVIAGPAAYPQAYLVSVGSALVLVARGATNLIAVNIDPGDLSAIATGVGPSTSTFSLYTYQTVIADEAAVYVANGDAPSTVARFVIDGMVVTESGAVDAEGAGLFGIALG